MYDYDYIIDNLIATDDPVQGSDRRAQFEKCSKFLQ